VLRRLFLLEIMKAHSSGLLFGSPTNGLPTTQSRGTFNSALSALH
jgi:hypothetical protein